MGANSWIRLYAIMILALASAGCELIEGIFQAGVWVGVILVVLVLAIVGWVASRLRT